MLNEAQVIVSKEAIQAKVKELGQRISEDYKGEELMVLGVLKGSFIFLADLVREISIPLTVDFISVSSYGASTKSSGIVKILKDIDTSIAGKHLLIVEDLIDTGLTLSHLKKLLQVRGPKSIKVCTILDKPSKRVMPLIAEYPGIEIPDKFVVGYGLDYAEKYRNLPEVYELLPNNPS